MKLGNLKNQVMASWLREQGFRLDAPPFLSGAIEARKLLEQLPVKKEPLASLTQGYNGGIYNGPMFRRTTPGSDGLEQALFILPRHTNAHGVLHGGMLSTFLDSTLGNAVRLASGRRVVTIHLSVDFIRMARQGEWLIGQASVTRLAGDTGFAEGRAYIGERIVGRATGIFRLMGHAD